MEQTLRSWPYCQSTIDPLEFWTGKGSREVGHGGGSAVLGSPPMEQLPSWGIGHG
jgi:hypothetical protein